MTRQKEIKKLLYVFEHLGVHHSENGAILIGRAPHIGSEAWLNNIYPVLTENEIRIVEDALKTDIPSEYKDFLLNFSNGLDVCVSTFYLDGLRKELGRTIESSRQPYSLETSNVYERLKDSEDEYFFIGGYNWDGSHLYIDKRTNMVHCCERYNVASKKQWASLEDMIVSELTRINQLFNVKGEEIDEDFPSIPY
ncbi:SMI1/KNR4 family protein [Pedobacter frigiditerrae]|uniref:SMI1/KNR4 family protein n=1 Tax=Pedobacter frigiditerrae TaxID=2530452 RepID=A0A4R0MWX8_9SPHI|nr:SMI1/KNR4 family protein [Pedobacter frigiditerrae]TCC91771.1 SMI1/KNR4 family protein [Pedobacter frigiditerrae]